MCKGENWNEIFSRLQCWPLPIERRDWWTRSAHCKIATRERENCWNVTYLFHFHGRVITLVCRDKRVWCIIILMTRVWDSNERHSIFTTSRRNTKFSDSLTICITTMYFIVEKSVVKDKKNWFHFLAFTIFFLFSSRFLNLWLQNKRRTKIK